jgi:imidazolonepropionase-like amidohydrolase
MPRVDFRAALALVVGLTACQAGTTTPASSPRASTPDPFAEPEARAGASVETPAETTPRATLIENAVVLTATGVRHDPGYVLMERGRIVAVGAGKRAAPEGALVVDARGKFVTPGIIDPHSHLGVEPSPDTAGHHDTNEATDPVTAGVRAEHSVWPEDPGLERAVAGGVTTIAVLPGSANLIGGRGVTLHLLPQRGARAMRLAGAPEILKMACGENPKRVYGGMKRAPSTRMANLRALRETFVKAQKYRREWSDYVAKQTEKPDEPKEPKKGAPKESKGDKKDPPKPPDRDLALETLALVLGGQMLVEWHCYQADDMLSALQVADEFGFRVRAFHHALEAYKIRDILAKKEVAVATWADWYGFKMEAFDGIPENLALVHEAGGRAIVHSDSPVGIQVLNQEAGKALAAGRAAGVKITEEDAIKWLTIHAAWALGIDDQVGSLEAGKRADVVVWSHDPFSVYARAEKVFIDGHLVRDVERLGAHWSDFELGQEGR